MSKVCGCGFKEACYIHCDHTDPRCPGDAYDMLVSNPDKPHSSSSNVQSEPPINTIEGTMKDELEKLFKDYKLHHKDINICFNDAIAVTHLITSIINLVDKELPTYRDNTDTKEPQPQYDDFISVGYNQAIDDMRAKLKGVRL